MQRFKGTESSEMHQVLSQHSLKSFEDIIQPFERHFVTWSNDRTTPESFIVGEYYSSHQILIFVGAYNTRAGGMFLLGHRTAPDAVVIKATLEGGRYPNSWLEPGRRLKYYLKSRDNVFGEHFQENAAILNHRNLPILCFIRPHSEGAFSYEGVFTYASINTEPDESKWFELHRGLNETAVKEISSARYEEDRLIAEVDKAQALTHDALSRLVALAPKKPKRKPVLTLAFERSPYVIAAALRRANGKCEICSSPAPFNKRTDGTPYLEVHHRTRLADDGEDTLGNAVAVCPNCHRKAHYG